eukprot:scaffold533285_cov27-Prasinocladus_malaysianus.AAC.1
MSPGWRRTRGRGAVQAGQSVNQSQSAARWVDTLRYDTHRAQSHGRTMDRLSRAESGCRQYLGGGSGGDLGGGAGGGGAGKDGGGGLC